MRREFQFQTAVGASISLKRNKLPWFNFFSNEVHHLFCWQNARPFQSIACVAGYISLWKYGCWLLSSPSLTFDCQESAMAFQALCRNRCFQLQTITCRVVCFEDSLEGSSGCRQLWKKSWCVTMLEQRYTAQRGWGSLILTPRAVLECCMGRDPLPGIYDESGSWNNQWNWLTGKVTLYISRARKKWDNSGWECKDLAGHVWKSCNAGQILAKFFGHKENLLIRYNFFAFWCSPTLTELFVPT